MSMLRHLTIFVAFLVTYQPENFYKNFFNKNFSPDDDLSLKRIENNKK